MRLCGALLKSPIPKQIEYYSRFSPSPLSIKQFLDFGEWLGGPGAGGAGGASGPGSLEGPPRPRPARREAWAPRPRPAAVEALGRSVTARGGRRCGAQPRRGGREGRGRGERFSRGTRIRRRAWPWKLCSPCAEIGLPRGESRALTAVVQVTCSWKAHALGRAADEQVAFFF